MFSAAHCFSLSGTDLQPENVKIGLGKLFVDYYNNEPGALVLAVSIIWNIFLFYNKLSCVTSYVYIYNYYKN